MPIRHRTAAKIKPPTRSLW